jgi:uncharacterized protein
LKLHALAKLPAPARLLLTLGLVVGLWLPLGLPILTWVTDPDWQSILGLGLAYGLFMVVLRTWGTIVGQRSLPLEHYGLVLKTLPNPWLEGWGKGITVVLGLYILQGILGWVTWAGPESNLGRIALEGFGVALGIGFAEELCFRGWLLSELQQDYGYPTAAIVSSSLFAILHFLKPWREILRTLPQFPGLLLLGLILAHAQRKHLGHAMGIHSGLVWGYYVLKVGNLVAQKENLSPWITGVEGNPLAGLLGLGVLTLWLVLSQKPTPHSKAQSKRDKVQD